VGPSPALNAYFKSNGEEIRVISGAANAGAALVVKADSPIKTPAEFRGKKLLRRSSAIRRTSPAGHG
jgi:NitT/TauT family transport system substrate-binding protein